MSEKRLDELVATLASTRPVLDDSTRARVAAALRVSVLSSGGPMVGNGPDILIGQKWGGYLIKRKLAEGGMGVMYEGEHSQIGRLAAIKVLKPEFCRSGEVVERFYQEARAVNSIRHENIVDIYDFGRKPDGLVFFVMEYLDGEPLSARIRRGALTWSEAFPILEQTLRGLKAAHDKGFVHRDLKPDNIWLKYVDDRVQVKLLDFGIAKLVGTESPTEQLAQTGSVTGTPHYMSPEQINDSRSIDHRTDIYAMGVIMYEMFAGITPFAGETLQALMTEHLFQDPPRLADIPANLGVPAPIAEIVDRMLVKDATARYGSVTDVLADLHDVNGNRRPTNAETLSRVRPTRALARDAKPTEESRGIRKRAITIAISLAGAATAVGVPAIWLSQRQPSVVVAPPTPPPDPTDTMGPSKPPPAVHKPLDDGAVREDAPVVLLSPSRDGKLIFRSQRLDDAVIATTADGTVRAGEGVEFETAYAQMLISGADELIAVGHFALAEQNLDKAAERIRKSGVKNADLDYAYGHLYDHMAAKAQYLTLGTQGARRVREEDIAAKRKRLLLQAQDAYRRFVKTGTGPRVQRANDRLTEIADELKQLEPP